MYVCGCVCLCVWCDTTISRGQWELVTTATMRWYCRQQTLIVLLIFIDTVETSQQGKTVHDLHLATVLAQQSSSSVPEEFLFCIKLHNDCNWTTSRHFLFFFPPAELNFCTSATPPSKSWLSSDFASHQTKALNSERVKKEQSVHPSLILSLSLFLL